MEKIINMPIDFHCHGVGRFDFTDIANIDLQEIENILAERNHRTVLTLYLPKPSFDDFIQLMAVFDEGRRMGQFRHIVGLGLEGPLLASHGGTPESGVWAPSKEHWKALAACGKQGLVYVILSPDAPLPTSNFEACSDMPEVIWITKTLLEGGVLPAPGHFTKANPEASAEALKAVFNLVADWGRCPTITDHLYNDMPHNFKHAWRTPDEKRKRNQEIDALRLQDWSLENLWEHLGPVPAVMVDYARKGVVKICQNFDGEHVDLDVIRKTVHLVGANNLLMMTDSIESKRLAGRALHLHEGSSLLYQDDDIVAAGSRGINWQLDNMSHMGLCEAEIDSISRSNPENLLAERKRAVDELVHDTTSCV